MKALYWRPREFSRVLLVLITLFSLIGLLLVETVKLKNKQPYFKEKMAAAQLAERAFKVIKKERIRRGPAINPEFDPANSGIVGVYISSVTSKAGNLQAKQTTVNPNFAALVVHYFKRLGIKEGEQVAVSFSGSFPAINIAILSACQVMGVRPLIISSASGSSFGANVSNFLWTDMEKKLIDSNLWDFRSKAASLGGLDDRAVGLSQKGYKKLVKSIERNELLFLQPNTLKDGIDERMRLYEEYAAGKPIRAYINVGGGIVSVGTLAGKRMYRPGLNRRPEPGATSVDSVMTRFIKQGVPLIHFVEIKRLATRYGLAIQPKKTPSPGEGKLFYSEEYNRVLAATILIAILVFLFIFIRTEWGQRLHFKVSMKKKKGRMEPSI